MKHEESLRAEKTLHQHHKATSVSVLRSPLDGTKSKYISSNQTARYEGNRGDLPTLCVFQQALNNIRAFTSAGIGWQNRSFRMQPQRGSQWLQMILDVLRNLKNDTFVSSIHRNEGIKAHLTPSA